MTTESLMKTATLGRLAQTMTMMGPVKNPLMLSRKVVTTAMVLRRMTTIFRSDGEAG